MPIFKSALLFGNLSIISVLYGVGWKRMQARRPTSEYGSLWRPISFYLGIFLSLVCLFYQPPLFQHHLFFGPAVHYSIILVFAIPLIVHGVPDYILLWTVSPPIWKKLRRVKFFINIFLNGSRLSQPLLQWTVYLLALTVVHLIIFYEQIESTHISAMLNLTFFILSFLFWRVAFYPLKHLISLSAISVYLSVLTLHALVFSVSVLLGE